MSLRGFHLVFIFLAILCSGGFYGWAFYRSELAQELGVTLIANLSGILAVGLAIYGIWFAVKKSKTITV